MTNVRAVGAPVDSDCKSYWHMTGLKHSLVYPLQYQQPKSSKLQHQQQQEPGPRGWGVGGGGELDTCSQQQSTVINDPANQLLWHQRRALIAY